MSHAREQLQQRFGLSFPPADASGAGRGRSWPYQEDQFKELHETAMSLGVGDRKDLLDGYDITLQTLERKAGKAAPAKTQRSRTASTASAARQPKSKEELVDGLEQRRVELSAELQEVERKLEQLQGLDEETIRMVQGLVTG